MILGILLKKHDLLIIKVIVFYFQIFITFSNDAKFQFVREIIIVIYFILLYI